jgi:hypothetical protein
MPHPSTLAGTTYRSHNRLSMGGITSRMHNRHSTLVWYVQMKRGAPHGRMRSARQRAWQRENIMKHVLKTAASEPRRTIQAGTKSGLPPATCLRRS